MVFTGYNRLGQSAPLRGYPSSHFIDRGYLLWSAEYRWPLIRRVDGTFFNEYAFLFQNPEKVNFGRFYNSWGFGFRVRTSSLFLTRAQVAFHGFEGAKLILTVSAAY
jgi:outer membrane protein assembly factor BamA